MNNGSDEPLKKKQEVLMRVLRATSSLPAKVTFYASALGAIALMGGADLPTGLGALAAGVGVNALSSILEKMARGDEQSNAYILGKVQIAIEESHISEKLANHETQRMVGKLFHQFDLLNYALKNQEYTIVQRITEQSQSYLVFQAEIRDEINNLYKLSSDIYSTLLKSEQQNNEIIKTLSQLHALTARIVKTNSNVSRPGSAPPVPGLVVGREEALIDLKTRLGIIGGEPGGGAVQILTAVKGWPGVGKTTIAACLAHDPDVSVAFPDGVLWTSLGENPNVLSQLAVWGRALGTEDIARARSEDEASRLLSALLRDKRMLLLVDDVWKPEHAAAFKVGGHGCAMLLTTRASDVARALAPTPGDVYQLAVLTDEKGLELLEKLAPSVVAQYRQTCKELVHELEGLPLALQVAGRMLQEMAGEYGYGVGELLRELREGVKNYQSDTLMNATAPLDRYDLVSQTTPTIAVLFKKSTDHLDEITRQCFAYLGAFASKPATFDLEAIQVVWQDIRDPRPFMRTLIDRGLLEYIPQTGRYQMHALLVMHARSLLNESIL